MKLVCPAIYGRNCNNIFTYTVKSYSMVYLINSQRVEKGIKQVKMTVYIDYILTLKKNKNVSATRIRITRVR